MTKIMNTKIRFSNEFSNTLETLVYRSCTQMRSLACGKYKSVELMLPDRSLSAEKYFPCMLVERDGPGPAVFDFCQAINMLFFVII